MARSCAALKTSLMELGQRFDTESTWELCDQELVKLDQVLNRGSIDMIFEKPLSTDPDIIATGSVIAEALSSAFWTNPLLFYQMSKYFCATSGHVQLCCQKISYYNVIRTDCVACHL